MRIEVFNKKDYTKQGKPKKKNNIKLMEEEEFKKYIKDNNLSVSYGYVDSRGNISNGMMFKCSCNGIIVGVSNICKELESD